jgi:predicted HNH restriction endonuclease
MPRTRFLEEETADELEGGKDAVSGYRLRRSGKLVLKAKERDRFTCVACGFHYHDEIVQAHHLDPLSERKEPKKTKLEDLVTLCPNCHYIAHFLLRKSAIYKRKAELLVGIRKGTGTGHQNPPGAPSSAGSK